MSDDEDRAHKDLKYKKIEQNLVKMVNDITNNEMSVN